jgi:hypothetical protein
MAKHTLRHGSPAAARAGGAAAPVPGDPAPVPAADAPAAPRRWMFYAAAAVWAVGFLALALLLLAESIPLLWDLIRFKL